MSPGSRLSFVLLLVFLSVAGAGTMLPNPEMTGIDGARKHFLAPEGLTVFIFFDPAGEHSRELLTQIAGVEEKMKGENIRWTGILSDRFDPEAGIALLAQSGAYLDLLIDSGDHLYGQLKVRLYPTLGIADSGGFLRARLPYTKANFDSSLEAHLLHALGRISDTQLEAALKPHEIEINSTSAEASRMLKLAGILWQKNRREKALEMAEKAVGTAPESAEAQAALGLYLAEEGECDKALPHLLKAMKLDPENEENAAVLSRCRHGD